MSNNSLKLSDSHRLNIGARLWEEAGKILQAYLRRVKNNPEFRSANSPSLFDGRLNPPRCCHWYPRSNYSCMSTRGRFSRWPLQAVCVLNPKVFPQAEPLVCMFFRLQLNRWYVCTTVLSTRGYVTQMSKVPSGVFVESAALHKFRQIHCFLLKSLQFEFVWAVFFYALSWSFCHLLAFFVADLSCDVIICVS